MIPTRPAFKPYTIVEEIDDACDSLIASINVRRQELHELLKEKRKNLKDLKDCRERAQLEYPHVNLLLQASASNWYRCPEFISNLYSHTYRKEREAYGHLKVAVKCKREEFRQSLSSIIDVVLDVTNPEDMSYKEETYQPRVMSVGCEGTGAGEYNFPTGLAIDEATQDLFVSDCNNNRVVVCSSNTGEYQQEFGRYGINPTGIAITPDIIFITNFMHNTLQKYSRPYYQFVMEVGRQGSGDTQFNEPRGITANPETSLLYVCYSRNNRIAVYDTGGLNHLYSIADIRMIGPLDVKLVGDHMYVLCCSNIVLFINEAYVRDIISMDSVLLTGAFYFSIDKFHNLIISDTASHNIKIFSPDGKLINTISKLGHGKGELYNPFGICITSKGVIICVSCNKNNSIQMFY